MKTSWDLNEECTRDIHMAFAYPGMEWRRGLRQEVTGMSSNCAKGIGKKGELERCGKQESGKDPPLLWPWGRPATAAPIRPLAWEPLHAAGAVLKEKKKKNPGDAIGCGRGWRRKQPKFSMSKFTTSLHFFSLIYTYV